MKNTRFTPLRCIAVLTLMMLITPLWAQTMHSGERSDDFTGIRRNMSRLPPMQCGENLIPVGSDCVALPVTPPQAGTKSWVSYFLGQSRTPFGLQTPINVYIAYDGMVNVDGQWYQPPGGYGSLEVDQHSFACQEQTPKRFTVMPIFTKEAALSGGAPYDWKVLQAVGIAPYPCIGL